MKPIKYLICFIPVLLICCQSLENRQNNNIFLGDLEVTKEITDIAHKWKDAVLSKDIDFFLELALPEDRDAVALELTDKDSELYNRFFGRDHQSKAKPYYHIFKTIKQLKVYFREEFGGGITVYYYDGNKFTINDATSDERIQVLLDASDIVQTYFFRINEKWHTSYEFSE